MKNDKIEYQGVIERIEGDCAFVQISQLLSCEGCAAQALCTPEQQQTREIEVVIPPEEINWNVGQQVLIIGSTRMARTTIAWTFIIPLLIFMATLVIARHSVGLPETTAGIIALATIPLYLIILRLVSPRLKRELQFKLKPL